MVEQKLEEVFSSLKDKLRFSFFLALLSFLLISCERSFENFDKNLLEKKKRIRGIQ
jgi:hypothetical protein